MAKETKQENSGRKFKTFPEATLFEEYSLFIEDTARFSDRRQTFSNIMVAVNALLVAGVATLFKDLDQSCWQYLIAFGLLLAGIAACSVWYKIFGEYDKLIKKRICHLKKIECKVGKSMRDGMYLMLEREVYGKNGGFTRLEKRLPLIFIALYSLLMARLLAGVGLLWHIRILRIFFFRLL